jgi:hypothetical protein
MSNSLYIAAFVLLTGWAIGVFALSLGGIIHLLLALSALMVFIGILNRRKKTVQKL